MGTFTPYVTKTYQLELIDDKKGIVVTINPGELYAQDGYTGCAFQYGYPSAYKHAIIEKTQIKASVNYVNAARFSFFYGTTTTKDLELGSIAYSSSYISSNGYFVDTYSPKFNLLVLTPNNTPFLTVNPPEIVTTYSTIAVPVVSSDLKNTYVDIEKDLNINYTVAINNSILEQFTIVSGKLFYGESIDGVVNVWNTIDFMGKKASIPANTLVRQKKYKAYTEITVDDGQKVNTSQIELDTVDTIPVLSTVSPVNEITYGDVLFSWNYINQTGTLQYAFDLQTSKNGTDWVDLFTHELSSITKASGTFEAGDLFWRVRGYNRGDVASEWSVVAKFINVARPTKPIISEIQSSGRPLIKWTTENQIAFELVVCDDNQKKIFDSGQVYTTEQFYKFKEYIENGNYQIKIRVYNKYGQVSEWLEFEYSQNMSTAKANAMITNSDLGFDIQIIRDDNIHLYYLIRNNVLIHKFDYIQSTFSDIFVNGNVEYKIRAVDYYDNFSDTIINVSRFVEDEIVVIDQVGNIHDLSIGINDPCQVIKNVKKEHSIITYLGSSKPSTNSNNSYIREWTINSNFNDIPLGDLLFYRDYTGDCAWVKAFDCGIELNTWISRGNTVLKEVNYCEGIQYD